jgi:protein ATS1
VVTGESTEGEMIILGSDRWGIQSAAPKSLKGHAKISASWHGVYIHNKDESLLAWGRNDRGQLPPPGTPNPSKLAVGSEHVLAVVGDRRLVAFGWGEHGNCGPTTDAQGNVSGRIADIPIDLEEGQKLDAVGAGCATSWVVIK